MQNYYTRLLQGETAELHEQETRQEMR